MDMSVICTAPTRREPIHEGSTAASLLPTVGAVQIKLMSSGLVERL